MKKGLVLIAVLLLSACHQQTMYHWHKEGIGMNQFVMDHNACLCSADLFPWTSPQWLHPTQQYNVRMKQNRSNGIWASYIPYQGAQPLYINSFQNDSTMLRPIYAHCMERRGYRQAFTRTKSTGVGSLRCDSISCQSGYNNDF